MAVISVTAWALWAITKSPPPGPRRMRRDLVVLEQAHRLAQQGTTRPPPLDELGLGPHELSGLEPLGKNGAGDVRATASAPLPWPDSARTTESGSSCLVWRRRR